MRKFENLKEFTGESLGTFLLTLFGCGSVAVAVLFGEYSGIFQIGLVWGIGVTIAIYLTRHLSNAHLNPAVSIAMVISRRMKARKLPVYLLAQFIGAFIAGWAVYILFNPSIVAFEAAHDIVRGSEASVATAKMFGEFYPNPGSTAVVSLPLAMLAEFFGTFLLALAIFGLTEGANAGRPSDAITPLFIGLTVSLIIWLVAPLTQAGLNPARDFSPRMVAMLTGWGGAALPDAFGGFFWVYMLAPVLGGATAAACEPFMKRITSKNKTVMNTKIILAGGFLGAGKTTLLWKTAQYLTAKGLRVGLITNDQAPELVDSALLKHEGLRVAEVSGSCFCCNFNGFTAAAAKLSAKQPLDVIIAEPVGSCTDLTATIIRPLKKFFHETYDVSPLTVLADPERLSSILDGNDADLHPDAAYIYRKQLEESDIILITKTSTLTKEFVDALIKRAGEAYPAAQVMAADSISGQGLEAWVETALKGGNAGMRYIAVDYDVYANGEAVLGWLNGTTLLRSRTTNWDNLSSDLLHRLTERFNKERYRVGHVKIIAENGDRYIVGNFTGASAKPSLKGSVGAGGELKLTVNARVETTPEDLDAIVRKALGEVTKGDCESETIAWRVLSPGRPAPTYRITEVA